MALIQKQLNSRNTTFTSRLTCRWNSLNRTSTKKYFNLFFFQKLRLRCNNIFVPWKKLSEKWKYYILFDKWLMCFYKIWQHWSLPPSWNLTTSLHFIFLTKKEVFNSFNGLRDVKLKFSCATHLSTISPFKCQSSGRTGCVCGVCSGTDTKQTWGWSQFGQGGQGLTCFFGNICSWNILEVWVHSEGHSWSQHAERDY